MHGHGFPWSVYRVLLPTMWHAASETKKLIQTLVKRRSAEGTKCTNEEYVDQAHWAVNTLA
jgi:hypothetical protein